MSVPILKQGDILVAFVQDALTDRDLVAMRDALSMKVGQHRSRGVVVDVAALDVMDSFATRTLHDLCATLKLRGAETIVAGIQPEVAFAMIKLGLNLERVGTALDVEEALRVFAARAEAAGHGL